MKKTGNLTEARQHPTRRVNQNGAYYDNLARVSATLLAGLVALFTFLLVVGVQSQIKGFSGPLYATLIILGVSLIFYVLGNVASDIYEYLLQKEVVNNSGKQRKLTARASRLLVVVRALHQVVFVTGVSMVVVFAINYSQLILNPEPIQQPSASEQSAPPTPTDEATPGETPEQHSQESQPQQ